MADALVLDLDNGFIKRMEKADSVLKDMVKTADNLTEAFTKTFNSLKGSQFEELISRISGEWKSLGNTKVSPNIDTSKVEKAIDVVIQFTKTIEALQEGRKLELFDTQNIYATTKGIMEAGKALSKVEEEIDKTKKEWLALEKSDVPSTFVATPNKKGNTPLPGSAAYDKQVQQHKEAEKRKLEIKLAALVEEQAIAKKELEWAKMTQDEKLAYVKKTTEAILNESKKELQAAQKDYQGVVREMTSLMKKTDSLNSKNKQGALDAQITGLEQRYFELNQRRVELESQYGEHLVEIAKKANVKILAIEADRILARQKAEQKEWDERVVAYRSTPRGALDLASSAETRGQMKEAQKYLQIAMDDVNVADTKMIKKLNEEYIRLRATIESLTTAEKNEQSLQPSLRNEYARLLKELDKIVESREKLANTEAYISGDQSSKSQMDAIVAREQDIADRVLEIRNAAGSKLVEIDRQHASERAKIAIDATIKAEEEARKERERIRSISHAEAQTIISDSKQTENLIQAADAVKKLDEAIRRLDQNDSNYYNDLKELNRELERHKHNIKMATDSQYALNQAKEIEHRRNTTFRGAMQYADSAESIKEQIQAIKYLKEARDKLTVSSAGGEKQYKDQITQINDKIKLLQENTKILTGEFKKSSGAMSGLAKMLAGAFSIRSIQGYVSQLMRVRGEFELQQRSLQALLQSKDEANKLWQQTTQLALKSPYSVSQLVRSTKQLAAYRIESEKLYETNKMLSDISAGVGVEVDRLILAYGQVKAANYLRGTELRQFSEAGINILGELANYFTALEGRAVSVGDVFERVSKRMVTFADVEAVLRKQVDAGGIFYRMQEKQAETLRGSMSNLKDQIDLMLNDIGQKNDGLLKTSVAGVAFLIKNWESLIDIMYAVGAAFAAHRLAVMTTNRSYMGMAYHLGIIQTLQVKQLSLVQLVSLGFRKLGESIATASKAMISFITANPAIAALTAFIAVLAKAGMALYEHRQKTKEIEEEYAELRKTATEISVKFNIAYDQKDLKGVKSELSQLISSVGNDYGLRIEVNTDNLNLEQAKAKFEEIYQTMWNANKLAEQVALYAQRNDVLADWWAFDTGFEGLSRDLNQYQSSFKKVFDLISKDAVSVAKALQEQREGLTDVEKAYIENLVKSKQSNESEEAYMKRVIDAYTALSDKIEAVGAKSNKVNRNLRRLKRRTKEAAREVGKMFDSLNIDELLPNEEKESRIKVAIDKFAFDEGYSDIVEKLYDIANKRWGIHITPLLVQDKNESAAWVKRIAPEVKAINEQIKKDLPEGAFTYLFEVPTDTSELSTYISSVTSQITEATQEFVAGQKKYSDEEVRAWQVMGKYADEMRTLLNISEKTNKDDIFSQKLRVVKEMYEEYKKLLKLFDEADARKGAMKKVGDAFKEAFGKTPAEMGFDLFSEEGFKKALGTLIRLAPDAKARLQAKLAKVDVEWEGKIKIAENKNANLSKEIEELFSGYQLSLELEKLNIPPDFARQFFGIESLSLDDLRAEVAKKMESTVGDENKAKYKEYLDKITDLETKAQQERLKKYLNYSRNAIGERAKIKLEELRQLKEIEDTFDKASKKEGLTGADKVRIEEQRKLAIEGVKKESNDKMRKKEWEDFKSSEVFVNLFQDLDNASDSLLNHAISKIREFKDEWKDMPLESAKEMILKLQELELALMDTGLPARDNKAIKDFLEEEMAIRGIIANATAGSKSNKALAETVYTENASLEEDIALSQQRIAVLEVINNLTAENKQQELEKRGITQEYLQSLLLSEAVINQTVKENNDLITADKLRVQNNYKQLATNTKILNAQKAQKTKLEEQADAVGKAQKMANDLYDAFSDLSDVLGGGDGPVAIFADMGKSMMNTVLSTIQLQLQLKAAQVGAQGLGAAMNTAMGVVGWIVMAVQLVVQVLTAIFNASAKARQELIDAQIRKLEELENKYDDLVAAMNKAYSTKQLEDYNQQLKLTYTESLKALDAAIALQEQKKDVQRGKQNSDDYKEYQDMLERREDLTKKHADQMVEIWNDATDGIFENTFDVARDFVDAWHDAFLETGDGMTALEENFDEMLKSMLRNAASKSLIAPIIKRMSDSLQQYVNAETNDLELTTDEAAKWKTENEPLIQQMQDLLTQFFGATAGWFEESGGLSELSKGIQGVTETTAQVIEAYLNSVRFYVADSNSKLSTLVSLMGGSDGVGANPMVEQLKLIAANTSAITTKEGITRFRGCRKRNFLIILIRTCARNRTCFFVVGLRCDGV